MKEEYIDQSDIAYCIERLLSNLGLSVINNPHFEGTPARVAKMWTKFIVPKEFTNTTFVAKKRTGYVTINDHICYSFCPHHLLPAKYNIKVGYLPENNIILGLSKLARICDDQMRKLPVQEDLGGMIGEEIIKAVSPKGVGVIVRGEHLCMQMRGVESRCVSATTTFMWGTLLEDHSAREEFLLL